MKKIVVGVLMGGRSIEREVSFNSGRTICDHLDIARYEVIPIFQRSDGALFILPWHFLHRGKTTDFADRLEEQAKKVTWDSLRGWIEFMYIAVHGRYAEDGTLQGMLEVLQIPYLGSKVFASALRIDKAMHKELLRLHTIKVPNWLLVNHTTIAYLRNNSDVLKDRLQQAGISFPCICKPHKEGSSLGVKLINSMPELLDALHEVALIDPRRPQNIVVEEKIEGLEFTCIILTDPKTKQLFALPPTEVIIEQGTHFFDYEQKYMPGRATKITPARVSDEHLELIKNTSIHVMQILGLTTMARIDGFLTPEGQVIIIDPNSLSGTDPSSFLFRQAAEINMNHTQVINHLIESELNANSVYKDMEEMIPVEKSKRVRVAVLFGGNSNEREISLESGRNIVFKLSPHTYQAIPVFVNQSMELFIIGQRLLVRHSTQEIADGVDESMKIAWSDLPTIADFVFLGLHGGSGENGSVQGALEMLNMPYNGSSVLTSALCMDKFKTTQFLKAKGFCVPQGTLITRQQWDTNFESILNTLETELSFPCIIKPHDDGCSVLVAKAKNREEASCALKTIFQHNKSAALAEEYIQGMELTVGVLGNEKPYALPPSQTVSQSEILSIEEKFLPGAGENRTPAPLEPHYLNFIKTTVENVYRALGCKGYARIDCFFQLLEKDGQKLPKLVVLEVNTLPALTPATCLFHQAAEIGLRPMELIDCIVQLGLQEHGKAYNLENPIFEESSIHNQNPL